MHKLNPLRLLPPSPDVCQECAIKHDPSHPHNQQSLYYQYYFYDKNGRWPTWADALSHCPKDVQEVWKRELLRFGVVVN